MDENLNDLFDEASVVGDETEEIDWFVISHDFRTITIPTNKKLAGVTSDEKVNKLYFKCPRTYGEVDLNEFNFRINYTNAQGEGDKYIVMDKTVVDDEIHFTWLVGRHACEYAGNINFIVCAVDTGEQSVIAREYNTAIHTLQVVQGIETDEAIEEAVYDVVEQFQEDFETLRHMDEYMMEIRDDMTQIGEAGDYADASEAYAIGTKRGVEVTSADPAYQNNSKWYSEVAGEHETTCRNLMMSGMLIHEDLTSIDITLAAEAEMRYIYGELYTLTISSLPATGIVDISFVSGSTPTVLLFPAGANIPEWFDPTDLNANTNYELSIEDNKVVISEWPITI